ncbi:MAG: acyl-CoA dehydrogenase family protein [Dermatophilaceae bacterium]|nr:acyl-CoA dehydrogenase family protein [Intrasporangiaceae bacterium]
MAGTSILDRGQRAGLRLLTKAGSLPLLKNDDVRVRVERLLYRTAAGGFGAQAAVGRSFARRAGRGAPARTTPRVRTGLFDLTPTEDQAMLQAAARELADEVIRPAGKQADADRRVPEAVRMAAIEMGLGLVGVPSELDGIAEEHPAVTTALVLEELARGDMGIAAALMAGGSVATAIARYGTDEQQATYLPHLTASDPVVAALALQEPQPLFDPFRLRTTATRQGGTLLLAGTKALVPLAASAELYIVGVMVEEEPRLVLVPASTPGMSVEDDPAMGIRAAATGRLVLTAAEVPAGQLLGTTDDYRDTVRRARLAWAACAVGTAQAALDQLIPYVKERTAFGEPIAHRQAVAFTISDIAIELEALRLVVWKAAARLDSGHDAAQLIAEARMLAATHGSWIGSSAVQLLGGHGFVKEWDNERWYRDLRGAGLMEGALLV